MKKIAIKVENKRQFDALMKHYEAKGWVWSNGGQKPTAWTPILESFPNVIEYCDKFLQGQGFRKHFDAIIDFSTFSQLTGVEVVNEVIVEISQSLNAVVSPEIILFKESEASGAHPIIYLTKKNLEEIYTAYKSLQS